MGAADTKCSHDLQGPSTMAWHEVRAHLADEKTEAQTGDVTLGAKLYIQ